MTTRVQITAPPEEAVQVTEVDGSGPYISAAVLKPREQRDFYIWGDGMLVIREVKEKQ